MHKLALDDLFVAVKECHSESDTFPNVETAKKQFDALSRLFSATEKRGHPQLAPRPYHLSAASGSYSMTWSSGRSLTDHLCQTSVSIAQVEKLARQAAEWLKTFHGLQPKRYSNDELGLRLQLAQGIAERFPRDKLIARAAAVLAESVDHASRVEMPVSWIHGDMKSDNLLVEECRIIGLDVSLNNDGIVAWDLASFFVHLELLSRDPRQILNHQRIRQFSAIFAEAYDFSIFDWSLAIRWIECYLLIQRSAKRGRSPWARIRGMITRTALNAAIESLSSGRVTTDR